MKEPSYILKAALASLSEAEFRKAADELWQYTSNPFEQGRKNQEAIWRRTYERHARRLIWC